MLTLTSSFTPIERSLAVELVPSEAIAEYMTGKGLSMAGKEIGVADRFLHSMVEKEFTIGLRNRSSGKSKTFGVIKKDGFVFGFLRGFKKDGAKWAFIFGPMPENDFSNLFVVMPQKVDAAIEIPVVATPKCTKVAFPNRKAAERRLHEIKWESPQICKPTSYYVCKSCGQYHLTSLEKS